KPCCGDHPGYWLRFLQATLFQSKAVSQPNRLDSSYSGCDQRPSNRDHRLNTSTCIPPEEKFPKKRPRHSSAVGSSIPSGIDSPRGMWTTANGTCTMSTGKFKTTGIPILISRTSSARSATGGSSEPGGGMLILRMQSADDCS